MKLTYKDSTHVYRLTIDEADVAQFPGAVAVKSRQCKSVTKIAKIPEDTYNIEKWQQRMVAEGLAISPHLLESVASHRGDRAKVNELCEAAMVAAGTDVASETGTTAHRVTELVDAGRELVPTPNTLRVARTWKNLLDAAGLQMDATLMERVVIYPVQRICGKFDRFARVLEGGAVAQAYPQLVGKLVVADLKTGKDPMKYPHGIVTQLATYANAPVMAELWDGTDGEATEFEPLPADLDRDHGLVVHLTEDAAAVYEVDIALGWRCVERIIFPTIRWRDFKPTDMSRKLVSIA